MTLPFLARYVSERDVIGMLYYLGPGSPWMEKFGEIASAITRASNEDPLFPQYEPGCEATACILVALAYKESGFHQSLVANRGKNFGLYQIQPPTITRDPKKPPTRVKGQTLLVPLAASFVAIDLIRTSFREGEARPWVERLSWYMQTNGSPAGMETLRRSMDRLMFAQTLFSRTFPQDKLPERVPMLGEYVEDRQS